MLEDTLARLEKLRDMTATTARASKAAAEKTGVPDKRSAHLADQLAELDHKIADVKEELIRSGYGDPQASRLAHSFMGGGDTAVGHDDLALRKEQRISDWVQKRGSVDRPKHGGDPAASFGRYLRGIATGNWDGATEERALAEGTSTAGGALVPVFLAANIIDLARNKTQVLNAGALTIPMASQTLRMARLTGENAPAWRSENAQMTEEDLTFDSVTFNSQSMDRLVTISWELMQDSDPAASTVIAHSFAKQIAIALDYAALRGTGTAPEPLGVLNTSGVTQTTHGANGTALTNYDWLLNAAGLIRDANFEPNAHIVAPRTATDLALLKNTLGDYLHPPASLLPILPTNQVPTNLTVGTSDTASEIYTGAWDNLAIGMRTTMELVFLRERYADYGQFGFIAHMRADVQTLHPAAFTVDTGIL
jgi:HK97 family phage major capsid protein